ncbi:MAG: type I pantothenate kinase, partial [Microbacterium sp.]
MSRVTSDPQLSLYRQIARSDWSRLAADMDQPLTEAEVVQIRGIGDRLDVDEIREVYLPLSRLLSIWANAYQRIGTDVSDFLGRSQDIRTPFVVAVAGSVSVGNDEGRADVL